MSFLLLFGGGFSQGGVADLVGPRYPVFAPMTIARARAPLAAAAGRAALAGRQHDACIEIPQRAALVGHGQIDADLEGT